MVGHLFLESNSYHTNICIGTSRILLNKPGQVCRDKIYVQKNLGIRLCLKADLNNLYILQPLFLFPSFHPFLSTNSLYRGSPSCSIVRSSTCVYDQMGYSGIRGPLLILHANALMLFVAGVIGREIYAEWNVSLDSTIRPVNVDQPVLTKTIIIIKIVIFVLSFRACYCFPVISVSFVWPIWSLFRSPHFCDLVICILFLPFILNRYVSAGLGLL